MRVNLGCGDRYADGWINVDHSGCPHKKDLTLDIRSHLPWPEGSLTRVYAGHVFEHLHVYQVLDVLEHLRPCMAPDGQLLMVGPDVDVALGMQVGGAVLEVPLEQLKYGAGRWSGDVHRWECTAPSMQKMLLVTGWKADYAHWDSIPEEWPIAERGPRWQRAVLARP